MACSIVSSTKVVKFSLPYLQGQSRRVFVLRLLDCFKQIGSMAIVCMHLHAYSTKHSEITSNVRVSGWQVRQQQSYLHRKAKTRWATPVQCEQFCHQSPKRAQYSSSVDCAMMTRDGMKTCFLHLHSFCVRLHVAYLIPSSSTPSSSIPFSTVGYSSSGV